MSEARRVVILEGDTVGRAATESLLRGNEYSVVVTQHAAAALRLAAAGAVDVVLADLSSGAIDGYAVLRPLPSGETDSRFPVVTLRANGSVEGSGRFAAVAQLGRPGEDDAFAERLKAVFGSGFRPAARPPVAAPPPFESTPVALRTALVADASEADRRAIADELVRHGFTVHEAGSAADALRLAVARRPWLVLAELDLPDEDGLALCRRMRGHSLLRRTPVVFLSARDDGATRYEALRAGADDFLAKPLPSREMLIRLELLLRRFSEIELGSEPGAGLRGAVELVGAPAVLQICHINQLTGVLVAHRGSQSVRIAFRAGQIVSATGPDHEGPQVVYDFVAWPNGQFAFDRGAVVEGTPRTADFTGLLLEGCRRLDERRR
ncbi:MAG TPA: response regulator, partial [Vicinamibacteria bacterium]